jgi:hypothetical protein
VSSPGVTSGIDGSSADGFISPAMIIAIVCELAVDDPGPRYGRFSTVPVATLGSPWHDEPIALQLGLKIGARTSFAKDTDPEFVCDETLLLVPDVSPALDSLDVEPDACVVELDPVPPLVCEVLDAVPDEEELSEVSLDVSEPSVGCAGSPEEQPAAIAAGRTSRTEKGKRRGVRRIMT